MVYNQGLLGYLIHEMGNILGLSDSLYYKPSFHIQGSHIQLGYSSRFFTILRSISSKHTI